MAPRPPGKHKARTRPRFADAAEPTGHTAISQAEALLVQNRAADALEVLDSAIATAPTDGALLIAGALLHKKHGNKDRAVALFEAAAEPPPPQPSLLAHLSSAYLSVGRTAEAERTAHQALALDPDNVLAHCTLGAICLNAGRYEEGIERLNALLARDPEQALAHWHIGGLYQAVSQPEDAAHHYREALRLAPNSPNIRLDHGLLMLKMGDFESGWPAYLSRFEAMGLNAHRIGGQRWNGEALPEGSLLLQCEQGLGDTIQQARYVPLVARRLAAQAGSAPSAQIWLLCQPALKRLLQRNLPEATVIDEAEARQMGAAFTRVCALLDLPALLHPTSGAPDIPSPYLSASDSKRASRLSTDSRARVGLIWAGSANHSNDRLRSMSLDTLAPLFKVPGICFVSLQLGPGALSHITPPPTVTMLDPTGEISDFEDTATIVSTLDLVITVDTSTAHLAGALGRPTWIFIPSDPDWRWMYDREDSPWYPTARLFRQKVGEGWSPVADRMAEALHAWVSAREANRPEGAAHSDAPAPHADAKTPLAPLPALPGPRQCAAPPRRPRVLVVPLEEETAPTTQLGLRALRRILPVDAQMRVVPVMAMGDADRCVSTHEADLVIVGVGDALTPDLLHSLAFRTRLASGSPVVGIFGIEDAAAVDPHALGALIDKMQAWMARTAEDVALFGRGRGNVVHLGHWLMNEVPRTEGTHPTLLVAGDPVRPDTDLDAYIDGLQQHANVRATTPLALIAALSAARRVMWDADEGAIDALTLDVFGQRFEHCQWIDVDRRAVTAYRQRLHTLERELSGLLGALLTVAG